jgi:TIGR03009 family protein
MPSNNFGSLLIPLVLSLAASPATAQLPVSPAVGAPRADQTQPQSVPVGAASKTQVAPQPSAAPFELNPQQRVLLDQVLSQWEQESLKIHTFRCGFDRWEYDPVFLQDGERIPVTTSTGQLKYARPDKGLFRITEIRRYVAKKKDWEKSNEPGEHWVCDGNAVYEYNATKKQLIVRELPPELRGKSIADGPLPFLFSADADRLKRRYSIRITDMTDNEIWLEAYPRYQRDAANYRKVELILDRHRFLPSALQVYLPNGKNRTVYKFHSEDAKVNDPLERFIGVFQQPRTPFGWKKVVEPVPTRTASRVPSAARPRESRK